MTKRLLSLITVLLVLSFSNMALAAVSPFSYVPTSNWTYDVFNKLAAGKIVENYNDNKVMTRFEMAQLVASAQTRSDIANAENKADIAKLSAEFATELRMLDNLPTLLAQTNAQQKAQPAQPKNEYGKIRFGGMISFGVGYARAYDENYGSSPTNFSGERFPGPPTPTGANAAMKSLMGDPQRTMFKQNFTFEFKSDLSDKLSWTTVLNSDCGNKAIPIDIGMKVNFLQYKDGNTTWKIGRVAGLPWEPLGSLGQGLLRNLTANDDGVGVQFGDRKTAIYQLGYMKKGSAAGPLMTREADARFMVSPDLQVSLAYVSDDSFYNTLGIGFNYTGKDFNVVGEYGKNTAPVGKTKVAGAPNAAYPDSWKDPYGWFLELNTGNLNPFKEGTKKYALRYKKFQPGFDCLGYGGAPVTEFFGSGGSNKNQSDWKGVEFRYNYMIKKQLQYSLTLSKTTSYDGTQNKDWASSFVTYFF